jgi:hypothetical protein
MSVDTEEVLGKHFQYGMSAVVDYVSTDFSVRLPMALLLLNERITVWTAKAVGKNHRGLGYACSRYTTSEPERLGKYDANSR